MIWQHPFAWIGAASVVAPIAIHLLGRGHARVYRFPTLRFIRTSRLLPTRRTRIHDPLLLAVRVLMLVIAAAALAQPLFVSRGGTDAEQRVARAVIVDTSAGTPEFVDTAKASVIVRTRTPGAALGAAAQWLERQSGRREIVVASAFPRGIIDSLDVAAVPRDVGLTFVRQPATRSPSVDLHAVRGDGGLRAHLEIAQAGTTVEWSPERAPDLSPLELLASAASMPDAQLALGAARDVGSPAPTDRGARTAVVFPGYALRDSLLRLPVPHETWMVDLLSRVQSTLGFLPHVVQRGDGATAELVAFCDAPPASTVCVAIMSSLMRAGGHLNGMALEPELMTDAEIARWTRASAPGTDVRRQGDWLTGRSDARWLWALVLALFAVEWALRRERDRAPGHTAEESHDLAA